MICTLLCYNLKIKSRLLSFATEKREYPKKDYRAYYRYYECSYNPTIREVK